MLALTCQPSSRYGGGKSSPPVVWTAPKHRPWCSAAREDFGYGGEADDRPGVAAKAASAEREESGDDFNASGSEDEAQDGAANEADISIEAAGTPASDEDALSAGGGTDADDGDSMDEGDKGNSI